MKYIVLEQKYSVHYNLYEINILPQREGHSSKTSEKEREEKVKSGTGSHKLNVPVEPKDVDEMDDAAKLEELDEKCRHQRTPFTK